MFIGTNLGAKPNTPPERITAEVSLHTDDIYSLNTNETVSLQTDEHTTSLETIRTNDTETHSDSDYVTSVETETATPSTDTEPIGTDIDFVDQTDYVTDNWEDYYTEQPTTYLATEDPANNEDTGGQNSLDGPLSVQTEIILTPTDPEPQETEVEDDSSKVDHYKIDDFYYHQYFIDQELLPINNSSFLPDTVPIFTVDRDAPITDRFNGQIYGSSLYWLQCNICPAGVGYPDPQYVYHHIDRYKTQYLNHVFNNTDKYIRFNLRFMPGNKEIVDDFSALSVFEQLTTLPHYSAMLPVAGFDDVMVHVRVKEEIERMYCIFTVIPKSDNIVDIMKNMKTNYITISCTLKDEDGVYKIGQIELEYMYIPVKVVEYKNCISYYDLKTQQLSKFSSLVDFEDNYAYLKDNLVCVPSYLSLDKDSDGFSEYYPVYNFYVSYNNGNYYSKFSVNAYNRYYRFIFSESLDENIYMYDVSTDSGS